jgi:hypothetical protein
MTKPKPLPPINELRRRLAYRSDGVLIWKRPGPCQIKPGTTAGTLRGDYLTSCFNSRIYPNHRIIWAMLKREDPLNFQIDHINGNTLDNRIKNLRKARPRENNFNRKGAKGYCFDRQNNRWLAQITVESKTKSLGRFDTEEQAREAYLRAKEKLHGEFMPFDMKHELGQIDGPISQLNIFDD